MVTVRAPATSANLGSGFDVFGRPSHGRRTSSPSRRRQRRRSRSPASGRSTSPRIPRRTRSAPSWRRSTRPRGSTSTRGPPGVRARLLGRQCRRRRRRAQPTVRPRALALGAGPDRRRGRAVVSGVAHSDNVAPSILGGFTVTTSEGTHAVDASIPLVVCLPDVAVSTRDARRVVPETASMDDLVETVGNAATSRSGCAAPIPTSWAPA